MLPRVEPLSIARIAASDRLPIRYKGQLLPFKYKVDFMCGRVIVEAKAVDALSPVHLSQVINYLKASGCERGLLINFGKRSLEYKRVIWTGG